MITLSAIAIVVLGFSGINGQQTLNAHYLNNTPPQPKSILICPKDLTSRAGRLALNPPGKWYNVTASNKIIDITLEINPSISCQVPETNFALFISISSFYVTVAPAFNVAINGIKVDIAKIDTSLDRYHLFPRSEAQFLSEFSNNPRLNIELELEREAFNGIDEAVKIDFTLVSVPQDTNESEVHFCTSLNAFVPKKVYCLARTEGFVSCPEDCKKRFHFYSGSDHLFDEQGFSFANCGSQRNGTLCGERYDERERERPSWKLESSVLWGVVTASVALFVVAPLVLVCVCYYKHRKY